MDNWDIAKRSGTADGMKWDSFTYTIDLLKIKRIINRCKWVQTVYEHIYTINIQYIKKWDTYVKKWDTHGEKWDVMSQLAPPIHAITYSPSSPHAYQIHNPFTYSIIKRVNNIYLIHIHEEGRKDTQRTVNVNYCKFSTCFTQRQKGGGPRVVVSTAAFHARVRGSVPGLGGLKETKMFLPHPRVEVSIVGSLRDRDVACSASDRQGANFESCVWSWRTVSSQSSHHPQEFLLAHFSLYVHKGGLKPDSLHFIFTKAEKQLFIQKNLSFVIAQTKFSAI